LLASKGSHDIEHRRRDRLAGRRGRRRARTGHAWSEGTWHSPQGTALAPTRRPRRTEPRQARPNSSAGFPGGRRSRRLLEPPLVSTKALPSTPRLATADTTRSNVGVFNSTGASAALRVSHEAPSACEAVMAQLRAI